MAFALKYSFNFRYSRDRQRTVLIPLEKLAGIELDLYEVAEFVRDDYELWDELLGDQAGEYDQWVLDGERSWKDMERQNQTLTIVEVED